MKLSEIILQISDFYEPAGKWYGNVALLPCRPRHVCARDSRVIRAGFTRETAIADQCAPTRNLVFEHRQLHFAASPHLLA